MEYNPSIINFIMWPYPVSFFHFASWNQYFPVNTCLWASGYLTCALQILLILPGDHKAPMDAKGTVRETGIANGQECISFYVLLLLLLTVSHLINPSLCQSFPNLLLTAVFSDVNRLTIWWFALYMPPMGNELRLCESSWSSHLPWLVQLWFHS